MRYLLLLSLIILAFATLLTRSGVIDALVLFMTIGAVPGTNYTISPVFMLGLVTAILWLFFVNISDAVYRTKSQKV